jgi:hypothetical protein
VQSRGGPLFFQIAGRLNAWRGSASLQTRSAFCLAAGAAKPGKSHKLPYRGAIDAPASMQ